MVGGGVRPSLSLVSLVACVVLFLFLLVVVFVMVFLLEFFGSF